MCQQRLPPKCGSTQALESQAGEQTCDLFQRVLHAELGSVGLSFIVAMVGRHAGMVLLKREAKYEQRKWGKYLDSKGRIGIYHGSRLRCDHDRQRCQCKDCGGTRICEHGRVGFRYKECGGAQTCEHGRLRPQCNDCGGAGLCEHSKRRSRCKECKVSERPKGVEIFAYPDPVFFAGAFPDSSGYDMSDS